VTIEIDVKKTALLSMDFQNDIIHPDAPLAQAAGFAKMVQETVADCPVMPGSLVVKIDAEAAGLARDYEGVRYHLCCAACGPMFDADPAKYAHAA